MTPAFPDPIRPVFRSVVAAVVPEARGLEPQGWRALEEVVESALRERPPGLRRRIRLLLRLLEWLPVLRFGRRFTSLDAGRRRRLLSVLESAPLLPVRRGVWGLRTLAFMGYYGRPEAAGAIGYDARLRGRREKGPVRGRGAGSLLPETPGETT